MEKNIILKSNVKNQPTKCLNIIVLREKVIILLNNEQLEIKDV